MALPFSTNPMTMAENIRKLEGFDGSIPIDKIPKDYSTDEQDTGLKWVDGESIYSKTVVFAEDPTITTSAFTKDIFSYEGINLIGMEGVVTKHDTTISFFDLSDYRSGTDYVYISISAQSILVLNGRFSGGYFGGAYITVYYTKPAPSPAPGNREPDDAPDAESELKKVTRKKTTKKEEE